MIDPPFGIMTGDDHAEALDLGAGGYRRTGLGLGHREGSYFSDRGNLDDGSLNAGSIILAG